MVLKEYIKQIEKFLKDYLENARCEKYILGISGGVDSSLAAVLAKNAVGKDRLHCVIIPIESLPEDAKDALTLAQDFDLNYTIIDASEAFRKYVEEFEKNGIILDKSTLGNLKARMRMSILYALAQKEKGLVIGTDNADERYVGYYTKWGDGACDVLPLAHLVKAEVVEASKILGISKALAERVPSAGLYQGQTDEKELGVSYQELDAYVLGRKVSKDAQKRISYLHRISAHKRKKIPMPKKFERD